MLEVVVIVIILEYESLLEDNKSEFDNKSKKAKKLKVSINDNFDEQIEKVEDDLFNLLFY